MANWAVPPFLHGVVEAKGLDVDASCTVHGIHGCMVALTRSVRVTSLIIAHVDTCIFAAQNHLNRSIR